MREAVAAAANSSSLDKAIVFGPLFDNSPQTITLSRGQLDLANNGTLGIYGLGRDLLTVSGGSINRIFAIEAGGFALLQGLTLRYGNDLGSNSGDGGGAVRVEGTLNVVDSRITDCHAARLGGGLLATVNARTTIRRSEITNNIAEDSGGGMADLGSSVAIFDSMVDSNTAGSNGGGVWTNGQEFIAYRNGDRTG